MVGAGEANLNAPEAVAPDVDLTLTGFFPELRPIGGDGADVFDARGGAGTGGGLAERSTRRATAATTRSSEATTSTRRRADPATT